VNWLYLWDFIDIVIFTLLIYGALTQQRNGYFLVLFVVAILNRESGLFIALWLILDALIEKKDSSCFRIHIKLRDPYRLIWGILLLIGGVFLIEYLREVMLIKSVASEVEATSIEVGRHVHIRFFTNLKLIFIQNFSNPTFLLNFLIDILVIGLPIWVIIRLKSSSDVWFKIAFIFLIIYSAIIIFGFVNETRVYNILIPFIIFLNAYFLDNDKMRVIKPA
jgi:hypothetical protein